MPPGTGDRYDTSRLLLNAVSALSAEIGTPTTVHRYAPMPTYVRTNRMHAAWLATCSGSLDCPTSPIDSPHWRGSAQKHKQGAERAVARRVVDRLQRAHPQPLGRGVLAGEGPKLPVPAAEMPDRPDRAGQRCDEQQRPEADPRRARHRRRRTHG